MTKRPVRHHKSDRLICPGASAAEIACDHALAPFDRAARAMDAKWGIDRLPELVSPETAAKYGSAMAKLNTAIDSGDAEEVAARVGVCIRGMDALEAEAISLGHQPMPADVWIAEADGIRFGVCREPGDWPTLKAVHPDLVTYTLREVALALAHYRDTGLNFHAVKEAFPGAQITEIRQSPLAEELDDEIVF